MHIPDNYLSPSTCAVMTAAVAPVWALSAHKIKKEFSPSRVPLLGVAAAFTFLFMMFNLPLPGGTTGHAVGGVLVAVLLGPWAACIALTVSLLLQAALFGDGGILAFGANCFNMAFVLPFAGYAVYKTVKALFPSRAGEYAGIAIGSYTGIVLASLFAAIEFGVQPLLFRDGSGMPLYCPYPLAVSIPAMVIPHLAVVGFVEAAFSVSVAAFIHRTSPGTVRTGGKERPALVYALVSLLVILSPLGLLAAGTAWGEWGADEISKVVTDGRILGFVPSAMERGFSFTAPIPDYAVPFLPETPGYILSAVAGAAILIIAFKLLSRAIRRPAA